MTTLPRRTSIPGSQCTDDDTTQTLSRRKVGDKLYLTPISIRNELYYPLVSQKSIPGTLHPSTGAFNFAIKPDSSVQHPMSESTSLSAQSCSSIETTFRAEPSLDASNAPYPNFTSTLTPQLPPATLSLNKSTGILLLHAEPSLKFHLLATEDPAQLACQPKISTAAPSPSDEVTSATSPDPIPQSSALAPQIILKAPPKTISSKALLLKSGECQTHKSDGEDVVLLTAEKSKKRARHLSRKEKTRRSKTASSNDNVEKEEG